MTTRAEAVRAWIDRYSDDEVLSDESEGLVVMDGYDDCIVGVGQRSGPEGHETFVVYDRRKVLEKLTSEGMTYAEAVEFHEYNQASGFVGQHTPVFLDVPEPEDLLTTTSEEAS